MGKGQCLPGLHVGWIKSPLDLVAGGPVRTQPFLGQLPMKSPSRDHRAQIRGGGWAVVGVGRVDSIFLWEDRACGHSACHHSIHDLTRLIMPMLQTSRFNEDANCNTSYCLLPSMQALCVKCF